MTGEAISVVIPVLGDNAALGTLLRQLRDLDPPPGAVVVVDGAASIHCRRRCEQEGTLYMASRAGRGHQLHLGARQAPGDILWFLHADATIPAGATAAILSCCRRGAVGGYFRFAFSGPPRWYKHLLAAMVNLRTGFGIPYGDQGLFATRAAYEAAGGFADMPLFEEVPLVKRLRHAGPFVALSVAIGVSPRRWERDGWLRRTLENRLLALAYMAGVSPRALARLYRAHHTGARPGIADREPG